MIFILARTLWFRSQSAVENEYWAAASAGSVSADVKIGRRYWVKALLIRLIVPLFVQWIVVALIISAAVYVAWLAAVEVLK